MKEFYIKQTDIQKMKQRINAECEELLRDIQDCRQQIDALIQNPSFQGNYANAVRSYMSQIHEPIMDAAGEIAREFQTRICDYETGFEPIEHSCGFSLPEERMNYFGNEIAGCGHYLAGYHDQVLNTILQISDIVDLTGPKTDMVSSVTRCLAGEVRNLIQEISVFENHNNQTMEYLRSMVYAFQKCMEQICEIGANRGTGYVSGSHTRIRGLQDLMDTYAQQELEGTELTPQMLENLKKYGYSSTEIKQFYDSCENGMDLAFFLLLADRNYEEAFQMNPDTISEEMDLIMADYALKVYLNGGAGEFRNFNNAILSGNQELATEEYHWSVWDRNEYRKVFMRRLYAGTELLLDMNSCLLLAGNAAGSVKKRNWNLLTLATIWNVQYQIMDHIGSRSDPEFPYYVSYDLMDPDHGKAEFQFLYMEEPFLGRRKSSMVSVKTDLLETSDDLFTAEYLVERGTLVREADHLWEMVLTEGLEGAFSSILAIALPEFAAAYGIIKSIATDPDSLDNSVHQSCGSGKEPEEKAASAIAQEALDSIQFYRRRKVELARAVQEKDDQFEKALWGSGGIARCGEDSYVVSGIYNPDYLETLGNWNRDGIVALLPDLDMDAVQRIIDSQYPDLKTNGLVNRMIHGFGNESILEYSMDQIAEAKTTMEEIVRLADNRYERWNVEDAF